MSNRPFRVQLDWRVGEEHLPLLYIKHIIEHKETNDRVYKKIGIYFDIDIVPGNGSPEGLRALVHNQCDLALSGAVTFAEHYQKQNENTMSVGSLIRKPPITILIDTNNSNIEVPKGTTISDIQLAEMMSKCQIGVFPNSTVRDWLRYFVEGHKDTAPRGIIEIPDAREFGTKMLHDIPLLVCYEYNQALEILSRSDVKDRFGMVILRRKQKRIAPFSARQIRLRSTYSKEKINYSMIPGVVFVASCTRWYESRPDESKAFQNRLMRFLKAIKICLRDIQKRTKRQLRRLVEEISEGSNGFYIYAPSRVLDEKLDMLRRVYWVRSAADGNDKHNWTEVFNFCSFPREKVKRGTKPETGPYYNPEI